GGGPPCPQPGGDGRCGEDRYNRAIAAAGSHKAAKVDAEYWLVITTLILIPHACILSAIRGHAVDSGVLFRRGRTGARRRDARAALHLLYRGGPPRPVARARGTPAH